MKKIGRPRKAIKRNKQAKTNVTDRELTLLQYHSESQGCSVSQLVYGTLKAAGLLDPTPEYLQEEARRMLGKIPTGEEPVKSQLSEPWDIADLIRDAKEDHD